MAYSAITAGEITEGEATKTQIFTKTSDNFQSHEDRLAALESGAIKWSTKVGSNSTQSITYVSIGTISLTVTLPARGIFLMLDSYGTPGPNDHYAIESVGSVIAPRGIVRLQRGTTDLCYFDLKVTQQVACLGKTNIPISVLRFVDHPGAGTFTYNWSFRTLDATNDKIHLSYCKAVAVPL